MLTAPTLQGPHGFFESDVAPEQARDRLLDGGTLVRLKQVHSPDAIIVNGPLDMPPEADALATATPNLALAIVTADCAPVLFEDSGAGVVAAAHAGWRGALGGVTDQAIGAMLKLGARIDRIAAAIGPAIAQKNYEVGEDFPEPFLAEDPENARFFAQGPSGKPHFDLEAYVVARLAAAGVKRIWAAGEDTYSQPDKYHSYRRATHDGTNRDGRLVSMIGMRPGKG